MTDTASEAPAILHNRWSSDDPADAHTVYDPCTGSPLVTVHGAGAQQVDGAVRAAHAAQASWGKRDPRERADVLRAAAAELRDHVDEVASLESSDNGKPLSQARMDVESATRVLDMYASFGEDLPSSVRDAGDVMDMNVLEPFGVIAGVVPFNWPPLTTIGKIAPSLITGNAVVIKAPEQAPLSVLRAADIVASVVPDDVVHVLLGGPSTGAHLVSHTMVGKISFTGSPTTGMKILEATAPLLTPTLMELGGKNPFVIFDDANLEHATRWAFDGAFFNQGEACSAASRVLVQRAVYDQVVERLASGVRRLRLGRSTDPTTHLGPLAAAELRDRVQSYIELGVEEGATVVAQGDLPGDAELAGGYFVRPTILGDVTADMRIANEEIFGPVVCIMSFDGEDEALRIANGTDFGLVGAVFTSDADRQMRLARGIRAGVVMVNNYNRALWGTPFGGIGHSGFGREYSRMTLAEYGFNKCIRLPAGAPAQPRWPVPAEVLGTPDIAEGDLRG